MTVLKVDWDRPQPPRFPRLCWMLRLAGVRPQAIGYRRTRRGWHVLIPTRARLDPITTVALQAVLGSDRNREAFNLQRARSWPAGFHRWGNVLFDRKVVT